jgi:hypothetical protein
MVDAREETPRKDVPVLEGTDPQHSLEHHDATVNLVLFWEVDPFAQDKCYPTAS